jgi:hypothetical protein
MAGDAAPWTVNTLDLEGTLAMDPVFQTLTVSALDIIGNGKMDLADNYMIVHGGTDPAATMNDVRNWLISGRNVPVGGVADGIWNGTGIQSSTAAQHFIDDEFESRGLAYALNSQIPLGSVTTWGGQSVGPDDVLVLYTRNGDASLDTIVGDDDASVFNAFYDSGATTGHQWYEGDFNFDGLVDDTDLTVLNAFYNQGASQLGIGNT